jgi:hypothetical protein
VIPRLDRTDEQALLKVTRRGRKLGNREDVFAKVGDSISQSPAFLQGLGCSRQRLGRNRGLRSTIRLFAARRLPGHSSECRSVNAFSRDSAATLSRILAAWAHIPGAAVDPSCRPMEAPLECEIRLIRPGYALILMGSNDVSIGVGAGIDTTDEYLRAMTRIVGLARQHGVVPVVSTIPPRNDNASAEELTERLNAGLVAFARHRHVPVINLWRALYPLPRRGMSSDGLHPSLYSPGCANSCDPLTCAPSCQPANFTPAALRYGYNMRNLITLTTLRHVHKIASEGAMEHRPGG